VYFTDRGVEELAARRGEEEVSLAWLAERRSHERGVRVRPPGAVGRRRVAGPAAVLLLVVTTAVAALVVLFLPRPARPAPPAVPLAAVPVLPVPPPGTGLAGGGGSELLGRRLPAVALDGDAGSQPAQDLRPAVVVLVPPGCGCTAVLDLVYRQAQGFRVQTWLIATAGPGRTAAAARAELVRADEDAAGGGARWAVDAPGDLAAALGSRGLTVALVAADGVLTALHTQVPADPAQLPALEPALVRLERP